jgi:N-methylhydantoinase A/oxoprolinase/acetone carboxylase beta subunit
MSSTCALAVDIGGTFTDLALIDSSTGRIEVAKTLTTPDDPAKGVIIGIRELVQKAGVPLGSVGRLIHATTLVTNSLITRSGAKTAFITTQGFRDLLQIGREMRYDLYDIRAVNPEPLVPRRLCLEVAERITSDGGVLVALENGAVDSIVDRVQRSGAEAVAICLINSYSNHEHEAKLGEAIRQELPNVYVSESWNLTRQIREYERASTTVANAYTQPQVDLYVRRLTEALAEEGFAGELHFMTSSGGVSSAEEIKRVPITMCESGPAAGAIAAGLVSQQCKLHKVLAFDMGGTTAKACFVEDGEPLMRYSFEVARTERLKRGSGLPIMMPTLDMIEIGAGGGSVAHIDGLGLLKVGPQSAGATPGPASYGLGGKAATVTDADLVLGYLDADSFLGGRMRLDIAAAHEAVGQLGQHLGVTLLEAATGIRDLVNENMASAARIHIIERGHDPRECALVATGGAAPSHAVEVGRRLGVATVICPPGSGVGSALGLLASRPKVELAHTQIERLADVDTARIGRLFARLEQTAVETIGEIGLDRSTIAIRRLADMRFAGQQHEVTVELPEFSRDNRATISEFTDSFLNLYRRLFGNLMTKVPPIEIVTWRLVAEGPKPELRLAVTRKTHRQFDNRARRVYQSADLGFVSVPVLSRNGLEARHTGHGPVLIEEPESTTFVARDCRYAVDEWLNLHIEREAG